MESSPATPRRSQRIQKLSATSSPVSGNGSPSTPVKMARRSPYLPTSLETALVAVYPIVLITGSLFALLDPSTRSAPYNATTQSHFANTAPSYFAKKGNVFNQFFVKQGWAWVTFSYLFFLFTHPATGPPGSPIITPRRLRGMFRYALVTVWWIFVTQWFFGPAIIDRNFILTGGSCEIVEQAQAGKDVSDAKLLISGVACKAVGGKWNGGHDISGHVFLLVLGSMFLFEEVLHIILKASRASEARTVFMSDGAIKSAEVEAERHNDAEVSPEWTLGSKIVLAVAGMSVYMLLMTAAYFHTWFEKLTGLLVAFSGIFVVYFLPRVVPQIRGIIGMPGV